MPYALDGTSAHALAVEHATDEEQLIVAARELRFIVTWQSVMFSA